MPANPKSLARRTVAGLATALACLAATAAPATLYEAVGPFELAAFDLAAPLALQAVHPGRADRVDADGGRVYWQSGQDIYVANADLSGAKLFLHSATSVLDFAVDAAAGRFYLSLAGVGVRALDLADPGQVLGFLSGDYTRVAAGGGKVFAGTTAGDLYASDGMFGRLDTVFLAQEEGVALADLAYDESLGDLYAAFNATSSQGEVGVLVQFQELPRNPGAYAWSPLQMRQLGHMGGVAAAGGQVVWSGTDGLYQTTSDWFTHTPGDPEAPGVRRDPNFGLAPSDLTLMLPSPTAVPEPGSAALAFTALAALGLVRRRAQGRSTSPCQP